MTAREKRECPECGNMVGTKNDGTLRAHKNKGVVCPGGSVPVPANESIEAKALRYISEGRVRVVRVMGQRDVSALVQGSDPQNPYEVRFNGQAWWCNCDAHVWRCSHVVAVQLVTSGKEWQPPEDAAGAADDDPEIASLLGPRLAQHSVREEIGI